MGVKGRIVKRIFKSIAWVFIGLILLILTFCCLLYVPAFQEFAKNTVLSMINKDSDMQIEVDKFRLSFPLDVNVGGVSIMDKGDTLLLAESASVDVAFMPLLKGVIHANDIDIEDVFFKSGTPDSVTYIRANVNMAKVKDTDLTLANTDVNLDELTLSGGKVDIALKTDTTPPTPPTPNDWKIRANKLALDSIVCNLTMPGEDAMKANVTKLIVSGADLNFAEHKINVADVDLSGVDAEYVVPKLAPELPPVPENPYKSEPITITVGRFKLSNGNALYATAGVKPTKGMDFSYLKFHDINIEVDSFYNRAAELNVPLRSLTAKERCGIDVSLSGLFTMNDKELNAKNFAINTAATHLTLTAMYGLDTLGVDNEPFRVYLKGEISPDDIVKIMPSLAPTLKILPQYRKIDVNVNVDGTITDLNIHNIDVAMRNYFDINLKGKAYNITDPKKIRAHAIIDGKLPNINFAKSLILDKDDAKLTELPAMNIAGDVNLNGSDASGNISITTPKGKLALTGDWKANTESYDINLSTDQFPVQAFVPEIGVGLTTAKVTVRGNGFDVFSPKTNIDAKVDIINVEYDGRKFHDITVAALLRNGHANVTVNSDQEPFLMKLKAEGDVNLQHPAVDVDADVRSLDLRAFGMTDTVAIFSGQFTLKARSDKNFKDVVAEANIADFVFRLNSDTYSGSDIAVNVESARSFKDLKGNLAIATIDAVMGGDKFAGRDISVTFDTSNSFKNIKGDLNLASVTAIMDDETYAVDNLALTLDSSDSFKDVAADLSIATFDITMPDNNVTGGDIRLIVDSNDEHTNVDLDNRDLSLHFTSELSVDELITRFGETSKLLDQIIHHRNLNVELLQKTLPEMTLHFNCGQDNLLYDYLNESGTFFRHVDIDLTNDSLINLNAEVENFVSGATKIDNANVTIEQKGDQLRYRATMNNNPGTWDDFAHVQVNGYLADDKAGLFLKQQNIENETGFNLGAIVAATDSTFSFKFAQFNPTIGYRQWTVNKDNFIEFNTETMHLNANFEMKNDESSIHIYTSQRDDANHTEAINVDISDIKIQEWISLSPFAPPIKGDLSTKINIALSKDDINGQGTITLSDFSYNNKRVGTFDLDVDLTTKQSGAVFAQTALNVDGQKVLTASGNLNDSTSVTPFKLDLALIKFPLAIANPFVSSVGTLSGTLNGKMDVVGSLKEPHLNGYLAFDSAAMNVAMLGTNFKISNTRIPVDEDIVKFDNFRVTAANENPLSVNGTVDLTSLTSIGIDLNLEAKDMMVINSSRKKNVEVYGKAFVDINATAKGRMNHLDLNANVNILPGTNATYVLLDGTNDLTGPSTTDLVHFVNFGDSLAVLHDEELENTTMMRINAILNIQQGAVLGVDLSADGKNRAQIEGSGSFEYTESFVGDSRFTGRYTINKGFVRYTPPLMSEKLFNFVDGSYVSFNGDITNPQFNITAIDRLRANVTQEGQNSRLIYFDVTLSASGSLSNMNVAFDLSTDDDITVENELMSMSPEQRASQAMNLLLYNVYSGPGTKANSNLSGNPLFSFLESQVNSWMANNIKGVDISLGIDQYNRTVDGISSSTMSYSYSVSKSLFDDRFKIIVGGNYSTDADADENFSQNLINDISFEYLLNKSGSMYVKLFRHTGWESILEGEVTETGVGFVYKQKLRSLRRLFRSGRPRKKKSEEQPVVPTDEKPAAVKIKETDDAAQ